MPGKVIEALRDHGWFIAGKRYVVTGQNTEGHHETWKGPAVPPACFEAGIVRWVPDPEGAFPAGECSCGRTLKPGELCCTFATYDDGSTDEPTCAHCCTAEHGPPLDRSYSPD